MKQPVRMRGMHMPNYLILKVLNRIWSIFALFIKYKLSRFFVSFNSNLILQMQLPF